jgi:hypothetical protein
MIGMSLAPLPLTGPVVLRIAADALAGPTDYADDQIWELIPGGDPAALALTTSYGRRAATMRIYPSFGMGGPVVSDPSSFAVAPRLEAILPSYLSLRFSPLAGLEVRNEVRVVDSHCVAGRITLTNATSRFRPIRLDLRAALIPLSGGQAMLPRVFSGATALAGKTGGLEPVLFLTGGSIEEPGITAGLMVRVDLAPGASRSFSWGEAGLAEADKSFERARSAAGRAWDAEIARLERTHDRWVDVASGNEAWDAAFHLAQQSALASLIGPGPLSTRLSIVRDRSPDRGFSPAGDGRDHSDGWDGLSAFEAYGALSQIVWAAPEAAADVIRAFLESQGAAGEIDARPGPAGQRARLLCPPLLGPLALRVHQVLQDPAFLEEAFRSLWLSFRAWTRPSHDRDGDGWPEWDSPAHPPWPVFWSRQGPDDALSAAIVEDPSLAALLYREAEALHDMAERLGRSEAIPDLQARRQQLRGVLQRAWHPERLTFRRIERDTHRTPHAAPIAHGRGPGTRHVGRRLTPPNRLSLRVATQAGQALDVHARVRGRLESGRVRVETLGSEAFRWMPDAGTAVSDLVFAVVESVEMQGLPEEADWQISGIGLDREDLTLFLPLWAGIVEPRQAEPILRGALLSEGRFLRPFGLASIPCDDEGYETAAADPRGGINPLLNLLLGEALVRYGLREEAADLLQRLLRGSLDSLRRDRSTWSTYHPETGAGLGRRNDVRGVPPLSLLLDILGIDLQSPDRVGLEGRSPFEPSIVVRWRGVEVDRSPSTTRVRFGDDLGAVVEGEDAVVVERRQDADLEIAEPAAGTTGRT